MLCFRLFFSFSISHSSLFPFFHLLILKRSRPSSLHRHFLFTKLSMRHEMILFRLLSRSLVLITYLCASASCTPTNFNSGPRIAEDLSALLRRQDGIFSVLGISGLGVSTIQPRLEIRDLERYHPDQWNVFLLGLQRFQSVSQDDKLSYFQIAGKPTLHNFFSLVSPRKKKGCAHSCTVQSKNCDETPCSKLHYVFIELITRIILSVFEDCHY